MARRRLRARVNWAVRWGGAGLCVMVLIAYGVSWSFAQRISSAISLGGRTGFVQLELRRGTLYVIALKDVGGMRSLSERPLLYVRFPIGAAEPWERKRRTPSLALLVAETASPGRTVRASLPLWPLLGLGALVSTCAVLTRAPQTRGQCPSCRYDLSGLPPGAPCPECGA